MGEEEFNTIYYSLVEQLTKKAIRETNSIQDAEDVMQQTWIAIHQKFHHLRDRDSLLSWAYRIVENFALMLKDSRRRRTTARETSIDAMVMLPSELVGNNSPDIVLEQRTVSQMVIDAMSKLKQRTARIIYLKHYSGMSFTEIAKETNINVSTCKGIYYRGIQRMKEYLKEGEER